MRLVPFGQIHFPHISSSYRMWSIYWRPRERTTTHQLEILVAFVMARFAFFFPFFDWPSAIDMVRLPPILSVQSVGGGGGE